MALNESTLASAPSSAGGALLKAIEKLAPSLAKTYHQMRRPKLRGWRKLEQRFSEAAVGTLASSRRRRRPRRVRCRRRPSPTTSPTTTTPTGF